MTLCPFMAMPTQMKLMAAPREQHVQHAHPLDEGAREERRAEHADDVPLQHECRVGERVPAAEVHGERRGAHDEVHHP
jgi:hypothetical protein